MAQSAIRLWSVKLLMRKCRAVELGEAKVAPRKHFTEFGEEEGVLRSQVGICFTGRTSDITCIVVDGGKISRDSSTSPCWY